MRVWNRHIGGTNKYWEWKKGRQFIKFRDRERIKKLKERHEQKKLQDKNIRHYLLLTIFLIPRLSIYRCFSVSIETCPQHQQATHTLWSYKAIPLRGRLQSEGGWWYQITQRHNNWRQHSRRLVPYGKAKKELRDLYDIIIISLPFHHLFHSSLSLPSNVQINRITRTVTPYNPAW